MDAEFLYYLRALFRQQRPNEPVTSESLREFLRSDFVTNIVSKQQQLLQDLDQTKNQVQNTFRRQSFVAKKRKFTGLSKLEMPQYALRWWDVDPTEVKADTAREIEKRALRE